MDELEYKKKIMNGLVEYGWDVQAHEDKISRYIPDLSFAVNGMSGWIEVKYLKSIPKVFKIEHLTKGQIAWLEKRADAGAGPCFLLVGTPSSQHLLDAHNVRAAVGAAWGRAVALGVTVHEAEPASMCRVLSKLMTPVLLSAIQRTH